MQHKNNYLYSNILKQFSLNGTVWLVILHLYGTVLQSAWWKKYPKYVVGAWHHVGLSHSISCVG